MRINVIIVIVGTRAIANFTPFPIFYEILMALRDLETRKVAQGSLDRVQVGVWCLHSRLFRVRTAEGGFYDI